MPLKMMNVTMMFILLCVKCNYANQDYDTQRIP